MKLGASMMNVFLYDSYLHMIHYKLGFMFRRLLHNTAQGKTSKRQWQCESCVLPRQSTFLVEKVTKDE